MVVDIMRLFFATEVRGLRLDVTASTTRHWLRSVIHLLVCAALPLGLAQAARGQEVDRSAPAPAQTLPSALLDQPIALASGFGTVHQKTDTSSPQAQAFYDQGLSYVASYMWIQAARSFHQALRADPQMAMAYLGLVDTYIGLQDIPAAQRALAQGRVNQGHLGAKNQVWLQIREREVEFLASGGDPDKYVAYRQAVNEALAHDPSNPWLWIQRGLADERSPVNHGQTGGVDTLSFYQTAISLAPNNFVAHHYLAHTLENLGWIKEALEQADLYVKLAPNVPHAHHMCGHELMRLGRTAEAIKEFQTAKELEESQNRAANIPDRYDWHYAHNLQLLAMSYELLGEVKAAEPLLREAFGLPAYTDLLAYNRREWPEFLLRRGQYAAALEASRELANSPWPMASLAGHTIAGEAFIALGRRTEAEDEEAQADRVVDSLPAQLLAALPYPAILHASLALHDNPEEGASLMMQVEARLRAAPGPDGWIAGLFELDSIAATARKLGAWDLTAFTAKQVIEQDPTYAGGYFALGLAAKHSGEAAQAQRAFANAEKFWAQADPDLPELKQARSMASSTP